MKTFWKAAIFYVYNCWESVVSLKVEQHNCRLNFVTNFYIFCRKKSKQKVFNLFLYYN